MAPVSPRNSFLVAWFTRFAPLVLVLAIALVYARSLQVPFIFDDADAVQRNPAIRRLDAWAIINPPADGSTTTGRPVVNVSFALNYALSGEAVWSYHAFNVAIHALTALALLGLLRRTLVALDPSAASFPPVLAALVALLWALHPLQTETVICIAQRTEALCGLFYLLTLYAFARAGAEPNHDSRRWLGISVAACLIGMATKEVMVTAPLVVLLYDRTFFARSFAAAWRQRRGFYVALAATWLLLVYLVLQNSGSRGVAAGFGLGVSPWSYLLKQAEALVLYLRLSVWPHPLVLDYGTAVPSALVEVAWQGVAVLVLLGGTIWALVRRPVLGFVGACFFLILAPSSSFIPLITQTVAEHRMYLPLAAVIAGFGFGFVRRCGAWALWFLAVLIPVLAGATMARVADYRDAITIWTDTTTHAPNQARAWTHLGAAYVAANRPAEALAPLDRALAINPADHTARRNRALALLALGRADEAAVIFADLPAREPGEAAEYFALGNAFARDGKFPEAVAAYTRTVALDPAHVAARANLGNALLVSGRAREAIAAYEAALQLNPGDRGLLENLAIAREMAAARR
jgi:tetratricopeptide (TPR) repeat protein